MNNQNSKFGPGSETVHDSSERLWPSKFTRLAWLPIPLLLGAIIVARVAGLRESYEAQTLTIFLSFIFYTLVSLGTIFLIARSFLASGAPGLLLLECGVLLWSLSGTVGDAVSNGNANINVTIFNTGILLAGLCHLAGSILSRQQQRVLRAPPLWLGVGCVLTLVALWLVTQAALAHWLPVFFIPGQGGTTVRYWVLISSIIMFVLSASLLLSGQTRTNPSFTSWYALALLLLAVGLFGVMIQLSLGSVVNWLGRTAQWLGGFYLLLSSLAAKRESSLPLLPLKEPSHQQLHHNAVAVVLVLTVAAMRMVFLPVLGTEAPFVTFYPAVILAALFGGLWAGLLATGLSAILVNYFWMVPVGQFVLAHQSDRLAMALFLASCTIISFVIKAMHSARDRASVAEAQVLLAVERAASTEALRESEEKYRNLFENMVEEVHFWKLVRDEAGSIKTWRLVDANPPTLRTWGGRVLEEIKGRTTDEIFGPGATDHYMDVVRKIMTEGVPYTFEDYFPNLDKYFRFTSVPLGEYFITTGADITGIKKVQEALRESESHERARASELQAFMDAVPGVVFIAHDPECREMSGSRATYDFLRVPIQGNVSKSAPYDEKPVTFQALKEGVEIPPEELPVQQAAQGREVRDYEFDIVFSDGIARTLLGNASPVFDENGNPRGAVGAFVDITERKQADEELLIAKNETERQARELEALMDATPAMIWISHDPECLLMKGNRAVYEFLGVSQDTNVSKTAPEGDRPTHFRAFNNGREVPLDELPMQKAAKGHGVQDYELEYVFDDGTSKMTLGNTSPLYDSLGNVYGAIAAFIDITERKQAEEEMQESRERLALAANATQIGMYDWDSVTGDLLWTQQLEIIYDYSPTTTTTTTTRHSIEDWVNRIHPDDLPEIEERLKISMEGHTLFDAVYRIIWSDGSLHWVEQKGLFYYNSQGQAVKMLGTVQDITKQKSAEEELNKHRDKLEDLVVERTHELKEKNTQLQMEITQRKKAEEEKKSIEHQLIQVQKMEALGRFAGGIAHDLNNILYPVIIDTEMLLEDAEPGTSLHFMLEKLLKAGHRQKDLINQILSFSRRREQRHSPMKVIPVLKETMDLLHSSLPSTIKLRQQIDSPYDVIIGDQTQLQQIIMNLCRNAADAIGSQKGTIDVSLTNTSIEPGAIHQDIKAGQYLKLMVKDTGHGMTNEIMDKIFEPFYTTKGVGKGSGMGLAVVHGILKHHGGTISVESEEGKGSQFSVYLPTTDEKIETKTLNIDKTKSIEGKRNILVVDDEEIILSSLKNVLNRMGYDVVALNDGEEAYKVFCERPSDFNLVITDLTMPQLTGVELANRLMDIRPDIPVILCTGFNDAIDEKEATTMGIRELLLKPASINELKAAIGRALDN